MFCGMRTCKVLTKKINGAMIDLRLTKARGEKKNEDLKYHE